MASGNEVSFGLTQAHNRKIHRCIIYGMEYAAEGKWDIKAPFSCGSFRGAGGRIAKKHENERI